MALRFFGKNPRKKYVRQIPNRHIVNTVATEEKKVETVVKEEKENKESKKNKKMADERLEKIEKIVGTKAPKRKVKVEKKDKGLFERTENSTVLLTEDNKMVLND